MKYIFYILSAALLALMLVSSRDAGISCDEVLHYNHSVDVYNYFATHGKDQSALNTPVTNLRYYGQSYDNIVTILAKWLDIEDVYRFRHLMSPVAGWFTVLATALFAVWLSGYGTGILVILLFAVSPAFLGHSQNNLKDIPFALGYIAGLYFITKYLAAGPGKKRSETILMTLAIAFAISIRAGGLILICYLFFFAFLRMAYDYLWRYDEGFSAWKGKLLTMTAVSAAAWMLGIILWPYALRNPLINVIESYKVMAHFPDTFRQIFEGREEWSDFMPWYYLVKSMGITIPLVVTGGFLIFLCCSGRIAGKGKAFIYGSILFSIVFPMAFVLYEKSNLYSSWRQFLFVYPPVVLLSAAGYSHFIRQTFRYRFASPVVILCLAILAIHPVKYMAENHRFSYIYYNQLVGGLRGAYGNYETDYYYIGQTEASEWLLHYLKEKGDTGRVRIKATYSIAWQFRKYPRAETSYFRYEERSLSDWDYAIITNRYIPPYQLKRGLWPPENAIHTVFADGVPVCAVLRRESRDDYYGYVALNEGRYQDASECFRRVLKFDDTDEMIFYNFATAVYNCGNHGEADSLLQEGLRRDPGFEPILMYLGNIARSDGRDEEAACYYEKIIKANRKYFEAYTALAAVTGKSDPQRAREALRTCLTINPKYRAAVIALADTYRESDPEIAGKYDDLAAGME